MINSQVDLKDNEIQYDIALFASSTFNNNISYNPKRAIKK